MPAILVECEFLTHPQQLLFLADAANQEAIAEAIAEGLAAAVDATFQHTLPRVVLG
jgi:N-acetylmuramoyl-L-alanine amidase